MKTITLSLALLVALAALPAQAQETQKQVPDSRTEIQMSFAPVVKRSAPAVVNVYAKVVKQQQVDAGPLFSDPFFRRFFGENGNFGRPRERIQNSLGSGVIVDGRGYIVTNNHVIKDGVDIRVALADRREFEAKLLLVDERTDLAVLKIDADGETLPSLPRADADSLEVGDLVLAIGNPFGVGQTVTSGIVSALARTQVGVTDYQFFIQTDAAINPGNSGGALVNMQGDLVGINTAIYSKSGGSIGIGFSIPADMVDVVLQSALAGGSSVKRPWLGVDLQDVTPDLADSMGFARPEGALVTQLHPQSPLAAAGLKRGDVIVAVDGKTIENSRELGFRIGTAHIGESRIIEYRRGAESVEASVKMVVAPETVPRQATEVTGGTPMAGMVVGNLSPAVAEEIGVPFGSDGVVVLGFKDGPAGQLFHKGDIIRAINGNEVKTVDELRNILTQSAQARWIVDLVRDGKPARLKFRG